jgi:hypothetical protein
MIITSNKPEAKNLSATKDPSTQGFKKTLEF